MGTIREVAVPDIGDFKDVPVVDVLVKPGDAVKAEDSLITLESDKATMDVPAPFAGTVKDLKVKVGDKVSEGSLILTLDAADSGNGVSKPARQSAPAVVAVRPAAPASAGPPPSPPPTPPSATATGPSPAARSGAELAAPSTDGAAAPKSHASPSVRRFARELGVDLARVAGSGPSGRILLEDVQAFVKRELAGQGAGPGPGGGPLGLPPWPTVDFAKFGEIELKPLGRIKKISGPVLHRNWVMIPHVTQFDEADITELEAFRKEHGEAAAKQGVRLTLLAFVVKASVAALKEFPEFNSSLDGENLVFKRYYHIGFAADTPNGLVVPVIREADRKGALQIAKEMGELAAAAREGRLKTTDLQGGTFSISSLGGIGGSAFTPIINAPEVAILGVSKSSLEPVYREGALVPRLMLPLSLSYDHRVIDGAAAARFTSYLARVLSDIRTLVL